MPFSVRRLVSGATFAFLFLAAQAAQAEAPARDLVRIDWPSVPGCPTKATVSALTQRAVAGAKELDRVLARVEITPAANGEPWRVHIRTRTVRGSGERTLEARTCDELARATALLVALAALRTEERRLDVPLEELAPEADHTERPPLFVERPIRLPAQVTTTEAAREHAPAETAFLAGVGLFVDGGALPGLAVGPSLRLEWVVAAWRARLGFVAALEQEHVDRGLGAKFGLFGASLDLCRAADLRWVRSHVCVGGELDQLSASGVGDERFEAQRTSGFVFGGLGAEWAPTKNLRLGIDLRMGPSVRRPTFLVQRASGERRELHEQSSVRGQAIAAFAILF
ncbi:MAG: hypothetical protein K0S65_1063 [Labilithrix sp.]|nr:hypothetical protein [Labilithrix sp.]